MSREPIATYDHNGDVEDALQFLKRTRSELRKLRKVHVWPERLQVFDVNGDFFELSGIGYLDADVVPILDSVNTVFRPERIHNPISAPFKEFKTGKEHPWAEDRIL